MGKMDEMKDKAKEAAGQHGDKIDQGMDKAGDMAKEKAPTSTTTRSIRASSGGSRPSRTSASSSRTNEHEEKSMMRKFMAALLAGSMLVIGGAACDDNTTSKGKIDEDDTRLGPGDGNDETGPGR